MVVCGLCGVVFRFSRSCVFQSCFGTVSDLFQTLQFGPCKSSIEVEILPRSSSSSSRSSSSIGGGGSGGGSSTR